MTPYGDSASEPQPVPSSHPVVVAAPPPVPQPAGAGRWTTGTELRVGAAVVGALLGLGTVLGPLWQAISPRTVGYVVAAHAVIPDENEAFIATDARFVLITAPVGVLAAALIWTRAAWRGPTAVAALAVGGLLGSLATALVGRWTGGGHESGAIRTAVTLPVVVRAQGLLLVEALAALTVYGVLVLFASSDDLGHAADEEPAVPVESFLAPSDG